LNDIFSSVNDPGGRRRMALRQIARGSRCPVPPSDSLDRGFVERERGDTASAAPTIRRYPIAAAFRNLLWDRQISEAGTPPQFSCFPAGLRRPMVPAPETFQNMRITAECRPNNSIVVLFQPRGLSVVERCVRELRPARSCSVSIDATVAEVTP